MKPIILTEEAKANALEVFKQMLDAAKNEEDLNIKITTDVIYHNQGIQKPKVFVLTQAYVKMITLINTTNKELAWHGVATRVDNNYLIEDILVYPQTVTSTTVDADEEAYAKWLMELPDETINHLRFQGHSHVRMSASPSGRDTSNWDKFLNLIEPGDFYLFCIGNKSNEFYWNIYDTKYNVLFENKDITMVVIDDEGNAIDDWCSENIDKYIKEEKPVSNSSTNKSFPYGRTIMINNQPYSCTEEKKPSTPTTVKEALALIPKAYKDIIQYEIESDYYYIDDAQTHKIPEGFYYSNLYGCYICAGCAFRRMFPKATNKTSTKKGGKK